MNTKNREREIFFTRALVAFLLIYCLVINLPTDDVETKLQQVERKSDLPSIDGGGMEATEIHHSTSERIEADEPAKKPPTEAHISVPKVDRSHLFPPQDCSAITGENIACPCGDQTEPEYHQNMLDMYVNSPNFAHIDDATMQKCLSTTLPMNSTDPVECWPKMVILATYPTSGTTFTSEIVQKVLKVQAYDMYNEGLHKRAFDVAFKNVRKVSSRCSKALNHTITPMPLMGKLAIYKTHGPKAWRRFHKHTNDFSKGGAFTSAVIRLARNPGDNMMRNLFRWDHQKCRDECFMKRAKGVCDKASNSPDWFNYHNYWFNTFDQSVPQFVYHYEHFSDSAHIVKATEKLLEFLKTHDKNVDQSIGLETDLDGLAKVPSYVQGSLMATLCGKEAARKHHNITKEMSEKLGYKFDYESATWSIAPP